ncbi:MAG: DNA polymerase III subunit beta [Candidatus Sumerlaeota bacterium]|nr:DNA polymerase III subunit beta [Candidatus Sumerlaeota bacterium]
MKVTFAKDQLVKAATVAQSLVNAQSSLPVLANVLIEAEEDKVVFVATDLESSVRCTVAAKIDEPGRTTAPARTFAELARELPAAEVNLELEGDLLKVQAEENSYHLQTMPAEDFPSWPQLSAHATLTLGQGELAAMLNRVLFAVPQRDPRKVLLGALFDVRAGHLVVVATDGKKLGYTRRPLVDCAGAKEIQAIVPHKILAEVQRNLGVEGDVRVLIAERQVAFDLGDVVYLSNKIDGTFPNYEMVIPKEINRELKFDRDEFGAAIRRASIISEDKNNSIIMRLEPERARITSRTYDVGDYEGRLPITYEGEPFDIAFNHKYLTEVMRIIEQKPVTMRIKRIDSPVVFVNDTDPDSLYLIMPIKMSDLADFSGEEAEEEKEQ